MGFVNNTLSLSDNSTPDNLQREITFQGQSQAGTVISKDNLNSFGQGANKPT